MEAAVFWKNNTILYHYKHIEDTLIMNESDNKNIMRMLICALVSFAAAFTHISTTNDSNNPKDGLWVTAKISI